MPHFNHIFLIGRKNHLKNDLGKLYSGQFLSCDTYALTFQMGSHTIMTSDWAPVAYGPGATFFCGYGYTKTADQRRPVQRRNLCTFTIAWLWPSNIGPFQFDMADLILAWLQLSIELPFYWQSCISLRILQEQGRTISDWTKILWRVFSTYRHSLTLCKSSLKVTMRHSTRVLYLLLPLCTDLILLIWSSSKWFIMKVTTQ